MVQPVSLHLPRERYEPSDALETLSSIAKKGEFWDCYGVEQKHLDVIVGSIGDADLQEATDAFIDLFEFEKKRRAAPTSHTNMLFPKILEFRRPGETVTGVVEAYKALIPWERNRHYIQEEQHALESMEVVNASLKPNDDRMMAVKMYMQDPDKFPGAWAEYRQSTRGAVELLAAPQQPGTIDDQLDWILVGGTEVTARQE